MLLTWVNEGDSEPWLVVCTESSSLLELEGDPLPFVPLGAGSGSEDEGPASFDVLTPYNTSENM